MISRSGRGMLTAAPVASTPLRTVRLSSVVLAIGFTVSLGLRGDRGERVVGDDGEDQVTQLEAGRVERGRQRVQHAPIHVALRVSHGVPVILTHQTLRDGDALA